QVGGGGPFGQVSGQFKPDHIGGQEVKRLPQHTGFGFNAADTPAEDAQAVDHGGVGVGSHQGVREDLQLAIHFTGLSHFGQVFQVDLVHDPRGWRHRTEVVEGFFCPAEQAVTLFVPFKLPVHVELEGVLGPEFVHHHRVVDHEVHRNQRVDPFRVTAYPVHGGTEGGQVDHGRDTGDVLQHDPVRFTGGFLVSFFGRPVGQWFDVLFGDGVSVLLAYSRF